MGRTRKEIAASKMRIQQAIDSLNWELRALESEEKSLSKATVLNDGFFWQYVAGILAQDETGLPSALLRSRLESHGFEISEGSFRTYLSRLKTKELLEVGVIMNGPNNWKLSGKSKKYWQRVDPKLNRTSL